MQLNELKRNTPRKKTVIGRGGTRGKTSGRGHKGQKSRAGHCIRPEMRDIIKRIPKRRGYGKNRARTVNSSRVRPAVVNLTVLEKLFKSNDAITPAVLVQRGVAQKQSGRIPTVKILGVGRLTKSLNISQCVVSKSAKTKIEKSGGKILINTDNKID
ncbi:50S ribosomal protein L15 [Patescibacteria group bacterium]|nr:50S ribosomal protein L15 [Patescibacteria group bacterium]MBU1246834.1 50S ribosomal protein L15 [Patescibacteria group bacterium]MBU1519629.1 50S ribosomal protein L15 [Patescibacteria group bacterium]MBU1730596.1 50S ribosomal protein L15 [Patescibacteria group bacterium]MBU1956447.1 50S ribosomal protein L15 [Patescibacteria group bacterium]